jgi:hypothetical protein
MFSNDRLNNIPVKTTSSKDKLAELNSATDVLVYGAASAAIKERDREMDSMISNTLKTTVKNQFGNTNKPLEYFSLNMLNDLWGKSTSRKGEKKKNFEDILRQYVQENQDINSTANRIKFDNYRNIYSHLPAAHVALNIYKSSILSPESLTDKPLNFKYKSSDDNIKKVMEQRVNKRIIEKYRLNELMNDIIKEALIDGVSYRAIISIEKDLERIMRDKKILTEENKIAFDENYYRDDIKFYDSEISKEQTRQFNIAIREAVNGYIKIASDFSQKNAVPENEKEKARMLIENMNSLIKEKTKDATYDIEYTGAQVGRFVKDLVNSNVVIKSKLDFMEDYTDALNEGMFMIGQPSHDELSRVSNHITEEEEKDMKDNTLSDPKNTLYLNGSKIVRLDPEKITPLKIGGIVIGYIYTEKDPSMSPMTVNGGVGGTANLSQTAPVSFGVNTFGSTGLNGLNNGQGMNPITNPLSIFSAQQTTNEYIVNLFINGLGKKLNKNFIRNNKDLKELVHELLREKYITQRKVYVTFFSSDDIIATSVKPLFEGSEFFAKLYLAELTNNITISLGRGMDRRMIKIPFGLDDDMYQTTQDAIRTFKTREFSVSSINDSTISNLIRLSPGRYEDIYVPVAPDGTMGYDIDILPGMDNTKSSELLPILKTQFLDSINIPASAIDSTVETDFSRSIALRNIYFSREVIDYQKSFNETATQIVRKIYTDEYRYVGNKLNEENNINLDLFLAWFSKPHGLEVANNLETMQNVEQYAQLATSVVVDLSDPTNAKGAHKLRKKIFRDSMSYLPWDEWEDCFNESKTEVKIETIKNSGKRNSPLNTTDPNDPNNFNPAY